MWHEPPSPEDRNPWLPEPGEHAAVEEPGADDDREATTPAPPPSGISPEELAEGIAPLLRTYLGRPLDAARSEELRKALTTMHLSLVTSDEDIPLDPAEHEVIEDVATIVPERDGRVAWTLTPGLRHGPHGRLIQPVKVARYRYRWAGPTLPDDEDADLEPAAPPASGEPGQSASRPDMTDLRDTDAEGAPHLTQ